MFLSKIATLVAALLAVPLAAHAQPGTLVQAADLQAQGIAPGAALVGNAVQGQGGRGDFAEAELALQPGCYLVSGAGGPGVEGLTVSLSLGKERLAKAGSRSALVSLVHCVQAAGTYRVRAAVDQGKGPFAAAVFAQPATAAAPVLDRLAEAWAAAQLPGLVRTADRFPLEAGARDQEWVVPVREGVCTTFVGVADGTAKELSLSLLHPTGKEQARTRDASAVAALQHCPRQTGTWVLRARLAAPGAASLARFESQPATGLVGVALAADRLGRAWGAASDPAQVLVVRADDGEECDWRLSLEAGCYLFTVLRGSGVGRVDVSITDPARQRQKASDTKPATVCAAAATAYKVRAVIADGEGDLAVGIHRVASAAAVSAEPNLEALCDAHAAALAPPGQRVEAWKVPGGKRPEWIVPMQPGTCYSFVGVGAGIKELQLGLRNSKDKRQAESREDRDRAMLDFCPTEAGSYGLIAQVAGKGSAVVVRYERAAPAPAAPVAAPVATNPGPAMRPVGVNVTVHGVNGPTMPAMPTMPTMPTMPAMPTMPTGHVGHAGHAGHGAHGGASAGHHQTGGGGASSSGTCCVNGRFYECSPSGMASCSEVASCLGSVAMDAMNSKGSMDGLAARSDACVRKLDTSACSAQPSRNGECK